MFWKNRHSEEQDIDENETKTPSRRIFGFQCSPAIHITAKTLAKQLHVDLFTVAEHAMQLGLMDIAAAMNDPQETELLREHLHEGHALEHLVESVSKYDAEAAQYIRDGQVRRYHREQAIRDLVELWDRAGLDPRLIREIVLQELRRRTEIMRGRVAKNE